MDKVEDLDDMYSGTRLKKSKLLKSLLYFSLLSFFKALFSFSFCLENFEKLN